MLKLPGPGPALAAPPRPHCAPAAGGFSAGGTVRSELPAPSLCPAVQTEAQSQSSNQIILFGRVSTSERRTYLDQELRDHFHVVVGLGHLLHTVSTEDWPERVFYFKTHMWKHNKSMQCKLASTKAKKIKAKNKIK